MAKFLKDSWLIAGLTALMLLACDATLKALLPESALPAVVAGAVAPDRNTAPALNRAEWAGDYFKELKAARHTRWSPWEYWRREAFAGTYININEQGIRSSWEPDEPVFTLWMLGGSTVWGTGARDHYTLPSALAKTLAQRGVAVRVVNMGESGYVSGQSQLRFLRQLEAGPGPDLAIFYDGVNDVFAALQAGQAGLTQNEHHRRADFRVTDGLDNYLLAAPRVLEGVQRLLAKFGSANSDGKSAPAAVSPLADQVAKAYAVRASTTHAAAQSAGVPTLFLWQPSVFSKQPLHPSEQAIVDASMAFHRDLQQASDGAVRSALNDAAYFTDLSSALDGAADPLLMDFCHLSEAGNQQVALAMADQVLALLTRD